jgi:hypothetical protein
MRLFVIDYVLKKRRAADLLALRFIKKILLIPKTYFKWPVPLQTVHFKLPIPKHCWQF